MRSRRGRGASASGTDSAGDAIQRKQAPAGVGHSTLTDEFGGLFEPAGQADNEPTSSAEAGAATQLPDATRGRMEQAFGTSFADVQVHPDSPRASGSRQAVTTGRDVHFAPGQFQPGTPRGDWLIGHELAHVVQQTGGPVHAQAYDGRATGRGAFEAEADRAADAAVAGRPAQVQLRTAYGTAQAFDESDDHSAVDAEPIAAGSNDGSGGDDGGDDEPGEVIDPDAELAAIAAEGADGGGDAGAAGGGAPGGGGGGGEAEPEQTTVPDTAGKSPEAAIGSLAGARPDLIAGALGGVTASVASDMADKRSDMADNAPEMQSTGEAVAQAENKTGEKTDRTTEGKTAAGADAAPAGPGGPAGDDGQGGPGADGQQAQSAAPHGQIDGQIASQPADDVPAAVPSPAPAAATGGAQAGQQQQPSVSKAEVQSLASIADSAPSDASSVNTEVPGKQDAKVALEGPSDPEGARQQRQQVDRDVDQGGAKARTDSAQPMGEDDIDVTTPAEVLKADVAAIAGDKGEVAAPELNPDMGAKGEAVGIIARQQQGEEIDAAVGKAKADMADERQRHSQDEQQRRAQADQEIATMRQQAEGEQAQARAQAQAEVEAARGEWRAEIDKKSTEAKKQADQKLQDGLQKVETEQKQADEQARQHITDGERQAEEHKRKADAEVKAKKREAEEKKKGGGGIFGWIRSKVKSFFAGIKRAITAAINAAKRAVQAAINAAKKLATAVIEAARKVIVATIEMVGKALIAISNVLLAAFPALKAEFQKRIQGLVDGAVEAVNKLADKLKEGVQKALDLLGKGLDAALGLLEKGLHAVVSGVAAVVDGALAAAESVAQAFGAFLAVVKDVAAGPGKWLAALGASVVDGIKNHLWKAFSNAVQEWFKSKAVEVLGIGGMVLQVLLQGGIDLAKIGKMAWEGLKTAIPVALITILVEKLVSMLVPAAGAVIVIIEGLQAAWGTAQRIIAAFGAFIAFLKAVKSGNAGPQFAQMLAAAAVVVIDFVANWLLKKLRRAAAKIGRKLKALAKRMSKKGKKGKKGKKQDKKKDKDKDKDKAVAQKAAKKAAADGWKKAKGQASKKAVKEAAVEQTLRSSEGKRGAAQIKLDADVQGKSWSVKATATVKGKRATASKGRGTILKNKSGGSFLTTVDIKPIEKRIEAMTRKELKKADKGGKNDHAARLAKVEGNGQRMLDGKLKGLKFDLELDRSKSRDGKKTVISALVQPNYHEWEIAVDGEGLKEIADKVKAWGNRNNALYNEGLSFLQGLTGEVQGVTVDFDFKRFPSGHEAFTGGGNKSQDVMTIIATYKKGDETLKVNMNAKSPTQQANTGALSHRERGKNDKTRPHDAIPDSMWQAAADSAYQKMALGDEYDSVLANFRTLAGASFRRLVATDKKPVTSVATGDGRSRQDVENAHGDKSAYQRYVMTLSGKTPAGIDQSEFRGKDWEKTAGSGTEKQQLQRIENALKARVRLVIAQFRKEGLPLAQSESEGEYGNPSAILDDKKNRLQQFYDLVEKEVLRLAKLT